MKVRKDIYGASYRRARELTAAGCPLDYVENLRQVRASGCLYIKVRAEGHVIDATKGAAALYILPIEIGADQAGGARVVDWSFEPPWGGYTNLDYDPADILLASEQTRHEHMLPGKVWKVLNERAHISRNRPVIGLLCGYGVTPVPASVQSGTVVYGKFKLADEFGNIVTQSVPLRVEIRRSMAVASTRKGRLFDKCDEKHRTANSATTVGEGRKDLSSSVERNTNDKIKLFIREAHSVVGTYKALQWLKDLNEYALEARRRISRQNSRARSRARRNTRRKR